MYDYLIVGAGLYGAVRAYMLKKAGKRVLVIDRRKHIGGNCYTERINGINVHRYGAHIFHTNNKQVWDFVTGIVPFNDFINSPIANYKGELYHLPFNMNTFEKMWGVCDPEEAQRMIASQRKDYGGSPKNLEEQAISLVGTDIYEKLVKGYTEKQWGRSCSELPAFIIRRLPVRFTYNNNYFDSLYQGIPKGGYTGLFEKLLEGIEVRLGVDFIADRSELLKLADKVIYTGAIDEYFDYCFGPLKYRSVRFETEQLETDSYQDNAVVNYTDRETPFTRIIEHKWFEFGKDEYGNAIKGTVISREYPLEWERGIEPYYPINDEANNLLYEQYGALAEKERNTEFGGRLGDYRYYDMDKVIELALSRTEKSGVNSVM